LRGVRLMTLRSGLIWASSDGLSCEASYGLVRACRFVTGVGHWASIGGALERLGRLLMSDEDYRTQGPVEVSAALRELLGLPARPGTIRG